MRPYYADELVTLYHGDCRQILPVIPRCDLLLTDPPFGIGMDGMRPSTGSHGGRKAHAFGGWDSERPDAATFQLLIKAAKYHVIWGAQYFTDYLPPATKWLVWDKGQRIDQSDGELAWTSLTGALRILTLNRAALAQDGTTHPTQKPEALIAWCLREADPKGICDVVLDPYAGSGTTLAVCKRLGRKAIGIEAHKPYCDSIVDRLRQGTLATLFEDRDFVYCDHHRGIVRLQDATKDQLTGAYRCLSCAT